jgi:hypothetical protein
MGKGLKRENADSLHGEKSIGRLIPLGALERINIHKQTATPFRQTQRVK